ncbi:MAG: S46 family peptidase, partial [Bacteroidales bacterium]
ALNAITMIVEHLDTLEQATAYIMEAGIQGAEITSFVAMFDRLGAMATRYSDRITQEELEVEANRLRHRTLNFFEEFDFTLEKEILTALVKLYDQNVTDHYKTKAVKDALEKYNHDHSAYIDAIFAQSIFGSQQNILHFLEHFTQQDGARLEQDPVFQLCLGFFLVNRDRVNPRRSELRKQYAEYHKEYVRIISQHADEKMFPDANRSLRLSFGTVKGFEYDGKEYLPHTNLQQVLEKHNTGDVYYQLPDDFVQLIRNTEDADQIPVCLINDSHTTGGSSGSPLLNARGELVGIGFDRVNHGLVSDFEYFPQYSRNISVDIRYVLFILEHYMEAGPLMQEISFAKTKRKRRFMFF